MASRLAAEFDPAAPDSLWISTEGPFKGAKKGDLRFAVTLQVIPGNLPDPVAPMKPVAAAVKR